MEEKREPLSEMAIERKKYRFFVISIWTVRSLLLSKAIMNMD